MSKNESTKVLCKKIKYYLRRENKVNENKLSSHCEALRYMQSIIENNEKVVLHYVKLANPLSFQIDFQKVDQHTGGK